MTTNNLLKFEFHPLAETFALMEGGPFHELVADIKAHGLREPIVLFDGKILDGRNRYRACHDAGVPFDTVCFPGDLRLPPDADPLPFVISRNLHRRHLTVEERAEIAAKLPRLGHGGDRSKTAPAPLAPGQGKTAPAGISLNKRAELTGVSPDTVKRMETIVDHGVPELVEKVRSREVPIATAAEIAKQPADEQRAGVAAASKPTETKTKAATKPKAKAAPKPKDTAAPKRKAAAWSEAVILDSFQRLVDQALGREAEVAGCLREALLFCDDRWEDFDIFIRLAKELAAIPRQCEGEERA